MRANKIAIRSVFTIAVITLAVIFTPAASRINAGSTNKASTYHAVVLEEGDTSSSTKSDVTRTVISRGIVDVDHDSDGDAEIVIDAADINVLAYKMNSLNEQTRISFDDTVKYKRVAENIYSKLGYDYTVPTTIVSGFGRAEDTLELTETLKEKIGY